MFCTDISEPAFLVFSSEASPLLYYSHIPTIIISILLGLFVFINNPKNLLSRLLLFINLSFSAWTFFNLIIWTSVDSRQVMFFWSLLSILFILISFFSFYFTYFFITKKDLTFPWKISWLILFLPVLVLTPTQFNLPSFDLPYCFANEFMPFAYYFLFTGFISFISILYIAIKAYITAKKKDRNQIVLATIGIELFLLTFFFASFIASYLVDAGIVSDFGLEKYGLYGMVIFMSFLAFLIVRYKAFNIKLLGAQALVVALIILIGSQFAFVESNINRVLTAITLVISTGIGLVLIRSFKRLDIQKELLEDINKEQEVLFHFISHQIKGFFTKSRNIFSTILEEENSVIEPLRPLVEEGLRSDKEGIGLVTNILNAASLKTGNMKYNKTEFDLLKFIENVVDDNKILAEKKGLKINLYKDSIPDSEVKVEADELRFKDIFQNIIQNAINYTQKGGVNISFKKHYGQLDVIVKDTGIGLSDGDKLKLFKPGGRGDNSVKYNVNSTGYGLYIANKVAVDHGGKITADSQGPGHGSTFTITIPIK